MRIRVSEDPTLVDVREHTARLWRLIVRDVDAPESPLANENWDAVSTPLHFAASISGITADTSYVDDTGSVLYCRPAADYDDAQSKLISVYVEEVTKFVWVWMALEMTIDCLCAPSRRDRIGPAVKFIEEKGARIRFFGLREVEQETYAKAPKVVLNEFKRAVSKRIKGRGQEMLKEIFFFYLCRAARNYLVHGNADMPVTDDWDQNTTDWYERHDSVVWVRSLARLVLFGLQSLLYAAFYESDHTTSTDMKSEGVPERVLVHEALQVIHLSESDYVFNQRQRRFFESDSV